jgi:hypothetical protein
MQACECRHPRGRCATDVKRGVEVDIFGCVKVAAEDAQERGEKATEAPEAGCSWVSLLKVLVCFISYARVFSNRLKPGMRIRRPRASFDSGFEGEGM